MGANEPGEKQHRSKVALTNRQEEKDETSEEKRNGQRKRETDAPLPGLILREGE